MFPQSQFVCQQLSRVRTSHCNAARWRTTCRHPHLRLRYHGYPDHHHPLVDTGLNGNLAGEKTFPTREPPMGFLAPHSTGLCPNPTIGKQQGRDTVGPAPWGSRVRSHPGGANPSVSGKQGKPGQTPKTAECPTAIASGIPPHTGTTQTPATGSRIDGTLRHGSGRNRKTRKMSFKNARPMPRPSDRQPVAAKASPSAKPSGKTRQTHPTLSLSGETADSGARKTHSQTVASPAPAEHGTVECEPMECANSKSAGRPPQPRRGAPRRFVFSNERRSRSIKRGRGGHPSGLRPT